MINNNNEIQNMIADTDTSELKQKVERILPSEKDKELENRREKIRKIEDQIKMSNNLRRAVLEKEKRQNIRKKIYQRTYFSKMDRRGSG